MPKRASVTVNPSSESTTSDLSGMSQTARRILETLEQFSSPLSDARKMPVRNVMGGSGSGNSQNSSPTTSSGLGGGRKRPREDDQQLPGTPRVGLRHLARELAVPTVPDMLRIRRRQKLQRTTLNARKIMSARTATGSVAAPHAGGPAAVQEYHIR